MVIQRKLLHTCNYTLYTVIICKNLWFQLNMGPIYSKTNICQRPTKTLVINYMGNSG